MSKVIFREDGVFTAGLEFEYYTEERTCQNKAIGSEFKCSKCDCWVTCADYCADAYICDGDWNYCPNCGRKVID